MYHFLLNVIKVCFVLVTVYMAVFSHRKQLLYFILLILPFGALQTRFGHVNVFLILIVFYIYMIRLLITKNKYKVSKWLYLLLGLIFASHLISFVVNYTSLNIDNYFQSHYFISLLEILSNIAVFLMVANELKDIHDVRTALKIVIAAYFISSTATVLQLIDPSALGILKYFCHLRIESSRGQRVSGTLGEYELYSEYTGIIILFIIYFFTTSPQTTYRILTSSLLLTAFLFLMQAKTRGGLVALFISLTYLFLVRYRSIVKTIGTRKFLLTLIIFPLIVASVYIAAKKYDTYNLIDHTVKTKVDIMEGNLDTREDVWNYAIKEIRETKNIFLGRGSGLRSQTEVLRSYPHNLYLYLILSIGLFGLLSYSILFFYLSINRGKNTPKDLEVLSLFMKAALLLFLIDQVKIEFFRNSTYQHIIWSIFGIIYVVNKKLMSDKTIEVGLANSTL